MEYTIIGKIINTHGIKGEVKVFPLTANVDRFDYLKNAYLGEAKIKVDVDKVKHQKKLVILKFKEYNDINEVLFLKDSFIYVDEEGIVVLPENQFFIHDLIDSQVFDLDSNLIGSIVDIIQGPSNDVYVIKSFSKDKNYLIPAVKQFIVSVNIPDKKIIIDPIEGMIE